MAFAAAAPLNAILSRLRVTYVTDSAFSDPDVLTMLNDAYLDACQSSRCLKTVATVATVAGQREYALPARFDEMIAVVTGGRQLDPIPIDVSLQGFVPDGFSFGYYIYGSIFGIVPEPVDASTPIYLLYSETPVPFTDFGQALDPRFPVEYADLLLHWVRWRAQIMAGGAERIPSAQIDRTLYETRLRDMRRQVDSIPQMSGQTMRHAQKRTVSLYAR